VARLEAKQVWAYTLMELKQAVMETEKEVAKFVQLEHDSARVCCVAGTVLNQNKTN
jgi:hypothetical protein